jgi:hypothetical protein
VAETFRILYEGTVEWADCIASSMTYDSRDRPSSGRTLGIAILLEGLHVAERVESVRRDVGPSPELNCAPQSKAESEIHHHRVQSQCLNLKINALEMNEAREADRERSIQ